MYHCRIHFYFIGRLCKIFKIIKEMPSLENFVHKFSESEIPEVKLVASADVIFVNLQDMDAGSAKLLEIVSNKKKEAELILLSEKNQAADRECILSELKDIWTLPLSEEEVRFRFLRWQQSYKMSKDFWQASQFLEAAINHIPNLVWYKDKNGIHEKVNDSFCATVNKTKEQVQGQGHAYIWDVEHDDPACIESEREVMRKQETCISEEIIETGEGKRQLKTYKSPLYDVDGSVMGTVGVAIDVTNERAYEEEIIKKNRTLETIFTTLDCGVMRHSLDGTHIFSINKAALSILGYESLDEMVEEGFDMIASSVFDEDREKLRQSIMSLKREGDAVSVGYRIKHKDGNIRHIMGNVKLLKENGEPCYQRFLLDCTEQKLEETRNKKRQMELLQALSIDFNFVCFFDLDTGKGNLLRNDYHDQKFLDTIFDGKILLQESMEHYISEFVCEEDRDMMRKSCSLETIKKEMAEKKLYFVNYRAMKKDKVEYFQLKIVRSGIWEDSHSIVLGFRSVDGETRKEMEQKSLLQNALLQANRANKAKSVFLSNMSHDIRTPMNAIVGFTALAITHIENKEQVEEYLKKIMTSGNHLLSLINDILDMSRIESGKMHLDEKLCSLPDILHGIRNIVHADICAKQIELYIDAVDVMNEEIYCDKLRLNQVLLNLLSNAIKYTGSGGIVSMRIIEKAGAPDGYANYQFHIKDTGIGMSREFVEHIFEPFERENNSTISGIQGTGLGMAITKNIVDMMNGSIEVTSEQGTGTEFIVSFAFRLHSGKKEPQTIPELKNCRALVVDDDFNTCDSVSYMLSQIGMRAEWTLSGKEAVLRTRQAVMRNDNYCVYIIDWLLPDMNGIEVTRRIRKEIGENVPIIVLTAYDWEDIEEEAKEAGVTAFCSKPLFLSELRSCLNSIINLDLEKQEELEEALEKPEKIRTGRILLVEDVDMNQEIAEAILSDAGFSTEIAGNGQIAVDMMKKSEPGYYQLVLMDIQMPLMNGYEAAREIRRLKNKELASVPIIAMTANAFEEDKKEAIKSGMNGHIAKPIDIGNLIETLDKILT